MNKSTKATRIRKMLAKGAPVKTIVKSTGSTPAYVYVIKSQMKKERQGEKWVTIDTTVSKTGITPPPPVEVYTPEKHEVPKTMWQRFKAAVGF